MTIGVPQAERGDSKRVLLESEMRSTARALDRYTLTSVVRGAADRGTPPRKPSMAREEFEMFPRVRRRSHVEALAKPRTDSGDGIVCFGQCPDGELKHVPHLGEQVDIDVDSGRGGPLCNTT
jgi:hypothetical protein